MKWQLFFLVVATLRIAGVAEAGPIGPMGRYYVTDESGFNRIWQFQGSSLTSFATVPAGGADGPIIVDGNAATDPVRSVKGGFSGGSGPSPGSSYDFAGTPQAALSLDFSAHSGFGRVIDAGFDGTNSYIVSGLFGSSGVFKYDAYFSGPGAFLFDPTAPTNGLPGVVSPQGITYDTTTNTIWVSAYDFGAGATGGEVVQFDLVGNRLSSFRAVDSSGNASERNTALAYDFQDDTFWMNAHVEDTLPGGEGLGELWQF